MDYEPAVSVFSISRVIIDEINDLNSPGNSFLLISQSNGWLLNNVALDFLLLYLDGLHLVEKENLETGKSNLKAIDFAITGSRITICYNNAACSPE